MKRSLIVAILLTLLAAISLGVSTASAGTVAAENAIIDDSSNFSRIEGLIETGAGTGFDTTDLYTAAGGTGGTYQPALARQVVAGMVEAEDAGGIGAAMGATEFLPLALTGVGASVGAFAVGWQVGGAIDHWLGISSYFGSTVVAANNYGGGSWLAVRCTSSTVRGLANGATSTNAANGSGIRWSNVYSGVHNAGPTFGDQADCADAVSALQQTYPFVIWMFLPQRSTSCTGTCINDPQQGTWDENFSCAAPCTAGSSTDANMRAFMMSVESTLGSTNVRLRYQTGSDASCSSGCAGEMYMTQAQMDRTRSVTTPGGTTNPGGTILQAHVPIPATSPGTCTYGSSCGASVRTVIKTNTLTRKWIVHVLDPTTTPTDPAASTNFTPLQPQPNETYTDYLTRLQAAGYVGTVTFTPEPTTLSGYGPNAVTRVQYTGTDSTVHTLDPLQWPTTVPQTKTDTAIVIRYNPSTATPAPTETSSNSCGGADDPCFTQDNTPDPGQVACDTCAIDWTPIESISVGTKFPFGVPTWFHDFFNSLSFSDSCTQSLDLNNDNPNGSAPISVPFCNAAWEDTYRPIVFPILEALMTIAAVTFLGAKIFGIGGGESE